jgi:ArsR family transcriptional regulator
MTNKPIDTVDFAKALADETRQQILRICCCQWLSVGEIVDATQVSQPTVSHHLGLLKAAGLVSARRDGKQVYYTVNQERLASACCLLAQDFAPGQKLIVQIVKA